MPSSFSETLLTTTNKFIRKETLAIMRKRVMLANAQKAGNIEYNYHGKNMEWKVRMDRIALQGYGDGDNLTFARKAKRKVATLPYRAYVLTQSINKADKLVNDGPEAIIKIWANHVAEMMDDFKDQLPVELCQTDGNAAANVKKWHGMETLFTGNTSSAGNKVATNVPTYAGLSTARGNYGGSLSSGTWPTGVISGPKYDFWSPLHVDATNTGWVASTKTWANTCLECLRFAIINTKRNGDKLDYFLSDKIYYEQLLNQIDEKERINVNRNGESGLVKLGFTDVVNFDGVDFTWGDEVPASTAYGICNAQYRIVSMQGQLIQANEDTDLETMSDRCALDAWGNQWFKSPRNFVKISNVTS